MQKDIICVMEIFSLLLTNCIPLILLIAAGYFAGKKFSVDTKTMADIAIFILSPVVIFGAVARLPLQSEYFVLPVALFVLAATVTLTVNAIAGRFLKDNLSNLIGMSSATANTGYFGLPIVLALFGPEDAGLYMLIIFALTLNESTFAYFVGARGHHGLRDSLIKVAKLPTLYALLAGLLINVSGVPLPAIFNTYWDKFAGAWTIIGMMLLGVALSRQQLRINWVLLSSLTFTKFVLWPSLMLGFIALDRLYLHLYEPKVYKMLLIIGCVPIAANVVAFATQLNVKPGEAATVVLATTMIAVFYIPIILYFFG